MVGRGRGKRDAGSRGRGRRDGELRLWGSLWHAFVLLNRSILLLNRSLLLLSRVTG